VAFKIVKGTLKNNLNNFEAILFIKFAQSFHKDTVRSFGYLYFTMPGIL